MRCLRDNNLNIMSGKFSNTATAFGSFASSSKQEEFIRQIAQDEVFQIMSDIKLQIETKIKSIDRNIIEIRNDIKKILLAQKDLQITALLQKMEKIEAQMQILKYHQQLSMKNSRSKSLDKGRKPIFKRDNENYDFSSVILGLEAQPQVKSQQKIPAQKKLTNYKPPLPKEQTRQKVESGRKVQAGNNNIGLEINQSSTVQRWLTENNNRESSCMSSIIKEQDMEQSVFY